MSLRTFLPSDTLKPFIKSMAVNTREKAGVYKILPDTGLIMNFQYSGEVSYSENDQELSFNSI